MPPSKTKNGAKPSGCNGQILRVEAVGPLMQQAVLAVIDPSPQQASWVEQALSPFTTSHDEHRLMVIEEVVRLAQADEGRLVGERLTTRAYGRPKVELGASSRKVTYEATKEFRLAETRLKRGAGRGKKTLLS